MVFSDNLSSAENNPDIASFPSRLCSYLAEGELSVLSGTGIDLGINSRAILLMLLPKLSPGELTECPSFVHDIPDPKTYL